ncbi:MAG: LOG family protein [Salinibacter sp.]|uniref:LOG family protein n=1 Tax=Salinibacter sp. TaxID=2065818 RepID=UPI0035D5124C
MYECCPVHVTEIESAEALHRYIEGGHSLQNVVVQGADLTDPDVEAAVTSVPAEDACFLGCQLSEAAEQHVHDTGGTVFPAFVGLPFRPYRASLYTPAELMEGYERGHPDTRNETADARIYEYFRERKRDGRDAPIMDALAFRVHDHAIDNALRDLLSPDDGPDRRVVGIMGGHQLARDTDLYRRIARLAWRLARADFFVATGGGPGAMEASNLGAALAQYPPGTVDDAVDTLAAAPRYEDATYVDRALDVRERYLDRTESLAVPTWFYGHEPSNLFATHVAKYFANSIREDGLLAIAAYGVVYAPGSAGTIQEIFMDTAQNHYETFGPASPMVFFDQDYWTETKPVYPLMETLAEDTNYEDLLVATDEVETAVSIIEEHATARAA